MILAATAPEIAKPAPWQARRRLPIGAEPLEEGTHFRVWAPRRQQVHVVLDGTLPSETTVHEVALEAEGNGYFSGLVEQAGPGTRYRFRLDDEQQLYPDPASRFQPEGPLGPSQVIDASAFHWTDTNWNGVPCEGQVAYELHVGTFTPEGTWTAALEELPALAELGITVLEVMPVAAFTGRFGWGYDGVNLFAPTQLYGQPDDFRRFVDRAHALGMGVILDVVYNHFGPVGNFLPQFSESYTSKRHKTDWGPAINFDGPDAEPVREFILANTAYWVDEFHLDGLRLDATQDIHDDSREHIIAVLARHARARAPGRRLFLVAENEPQQTRLVRAVEDGGYALDALWNDDFHHSAHVALTGRNPAYYQDYLGSPQELLSALKWGYLYQGQRYAWQKKRRGTPSWGVPPSAFVTFLQNHDQVANSARGLRCHQLTSPGRYRALTALLLLGPGTPMLFQGQEFAASSPFFYFADHETELAHLVARGRLEFLAQFPTLQDKAAQDCVRLPHDPATFQLCKLDPAERAANGAVVALHRDLLRLRREDEVIRAGRIDGAVLAPEAFVVRFFETTGDDRLLLVNLGRDLDLSPAPEPLLAPPEGCRWHMLFSTEDPAYGGCGTGPVETEDDGWHLPGHAAVLLRGQPIVT